MMGGSIRRRSDDSHCDLCDQPLDAHEPLYLTVNGMTEKHPLCPMSFADGSLQPAGRR